MNSLGEKITREYNEKVVREGGGREGGVARNRFRALRRPPQPCVHLPPCHPLIPVLAPPPFPQVEYQEVLQKVQRLFAAEGPQKVEKDAAAQVRPDRSPVGQADTARVGREGGREGGRRM
jgi:hypothetical protein